MAHIRKVVRQLLYHIWRSSIFDGTRALDTARPGSSSALKELFMHINTVWLAPLTLSTLFWICTLSVQEFIFPKRIGELECIAGMEIVNRRITPLSMFGFKATRKQTGSGVINWPVSWSTSERTIKPCINAQASKGQHVHLLPLSTFRATSVLQCLDRPHDSPHWPECTSLTVYVSKPDFIFWRFNGRSYLIN